MPQVINTNIASLNSQRNLNTSQSSLQTALQRLSSGLRINSAKDDAAGMAISERMTSQVRGLNQAARNANDGVSLAQTADSTLAEMTSNLQRIRELAVQSANSTNTSADRAALDLEVQQRISEIDRSASQTAFNGQKILDGTFGSAAFQIGANVGETISIALSTSTRTSAIGKTADIVGGSVYSSALAVGQQGTGVTANALTGAAGSLSIAVGTGQAVGVGATAAGTATGQTSGSAYAKAAAINTSGISGLTASADTTLQVAFTTVTDADYKLTINGVTIATGAYNVNNITGAGMAQLINQNQSATGTSASYDSTTGNLTLNAADGRNIAIQQSNAAAGAATLTGLGIVTNAGGRTNNTVNVALTTFLTSFASQSAVGSIKLSAADSITVAGTQVADIGYAATNYAIGNAALSSASVTTVNNANVTISRVDAALSSVSSLRSTFGAIQNRFESAINSLQATSENLTAARSRIQDTDFAAETAQLTRSQIMQQAGVAMLAQANQLPQLVLSLLK